MDSVDDFSISSDHLKTIFDNHTITVQNITKLTEEEIKELIPAIGDRIVFREAVKLRGDLETSKICNPHYANDYYRTNGICYFKQKTYKPYSPLSDVVIPLICFHNVKQRQNYKSVNNSVHRTYTMFSYYAKKTVHDGVHVNITCTKHHIDELQHLYMDQKEINRQLEYLATLRELINNLKKKREDDEAEFRRVSEAYELMSENTDKGTDCGVGTHENELIK